MLAHMFVFAAYRNFLNEFGAVAIFLRGENSAVYGGEDVTPTGREVSS
jgi:hypothetical protein